MAPMELDNLNKSPEAVQQERHVFKITHFLESHGIHNLNAPEIDVLLALGVYNPSKDKITCRAYHAKEDRKCLGQPPAKLIAVGLLLVARLSQRFNSIEEAIQRDLQDVVGHFVCAQKHRSDDQALRELFEEWCPVILQHQERAKERVVQPHLTPLQQDNQSLRAQGNMLLKEHRLLQNNIEAVIERRVGQKIEQQAEEKAQEWKSEAETMISQRDELLKVREHELQECHRIIQNLMTKNGQQEQA